MKIQVVKKGSNKVKFSEPCPWLVEVPPETGKK
jgi:hypothetical protein